MNKAYCCEQGELLEVEVCPECACLGVQEAGGGVGLAHDLWGKGDPGIPPVITDSNGDVTLGLCKRCGQEAFNLGDTIMDLVADGHDDMEDRIREAIRDSLCNGQPATPPTGAASRALADEIEAAAIVLRRALTHVNNRIDRDLVGLAESAEHWIRGSQILLDYPPPCDRCEAASRGGAVAAQLRRELATDHADYPYTAYERGRVDEKKRCLDLLNAAQQDRSHE